MKIIPLQKIKYTEMWDKKYDTKSDILIFSGSISYKYETMMQITLNETNF